MANNYYKTRGGSWVKKPWCDDCQMYATRLHWRVGNASEATEDFKCRGCRKHMVGLL